MFREDAGRPDGSGAPPSTTMPKAVELPKGYHKKVVGFIGSQQVVITMDSGSFRNVINEGFLKHLRSWLALHDLRWSQCRAIWSRSEERSRG